MENWKAFLAAGQDALRQANWSAAKAHFEESLRLQDSPAAHDGLGIALWWLNDVSASHTHRTLAYNRYKQQGDLKQAMLIASWLAREQVFLHGNTAAMNGWFARAAWLQQQIGPCVESAWGDIFKASMVEPPEGLEQVAHQTIETARWFGVGTPAGLDQWFFETGEPAQALTLPPPPSAPPDVEAIVNSLRRYGTETLGPPPGLNGHGD